MPAYTLNLTEDDVKMITFAGPRYGWSASLMHMEAGENELTEAAALKIMEMIEGDLNRGRYFPMLNHGSDLADKLFTLFDSVA